MGQAMGTGRNEDIRGAIIALLAGAAILQICAAAWLFEDEINDALNTLPVTKGEISGVTELFANIVGWGIILGANLLWLPGAIVGPWPLAVLAGVCTLAAGYLRLRLRARGKH